ncbi:MAG: hypothetical protein PHQ72_00590 [Hespellia sp.]|nr:hypothetical protein [Hespellia sp.]
MNENSISEDAKNLFIESVLCYRIGAYRSAFIMSYIGLQNILKQRILDAVIIPDGINRSNWNTICSKLRDEDTWDHEVSDAVKRTSPNKIFLIPASTVAIYEAFRCIRNTCAHGKAGIVSYFQVEHLWSFIQDNYTKFVINGSKQGIIQMIADHYNTSLTAVGSDPTYIINNIKIGIKNDEMNDLLESLYQMCVDEKPFGNGFSNQWRQIEIWDKLMRETNNEIQDSIIYFMKNNHVEEIDNFITRYPESSDLFLGDEFFVRKLWKDIIFKNWDNENEGTWIILDKIINMVPDVEKPGFNKQFYKFIGKSFPKDKTEIFAKTDYFVRLKRDLFAMETYEYPVTFDNANMNARYMISYLKEFGFDKESVIVINSIIAKMQYGSFIDAIHSYLKKDNNWDEYRRILLEASIDDNSIKFENE